MLIHLSRFPCKIPVSYDLEPSLCLHIERVPLYSACGHWQVRDQFILLGPPSPMATWDMPFGLAP